MAVKGVRAVGSDVQEPIMQSKIGRKTALYYVTNLTYEEKIMERRHIASNSFDVTLPNIYC